MANITKSENSLLTKIKNDFIGLDTCLAIMEVLHRDLDDDKYRPCPLLIEMVEQGKLGKKSGEGFYKY